MERLVCCMVPGGCRARGTRAAGARRRPDPVRRSAPGAGSRLLPLREVPVRPGHVAAPRGACIRRPLPDRCAAAPGPARPADRDPVRWQRPGWDPAPAEDGRRAGDRDPDLRPDSAKEELRATEALFLDRGLATFAVDG